MAHPRSDTVPELLRAIITARSGQIVTYVELASGAGITGTNPRKTIAVHMVAVRNKIPSDSEIVALDGRGYIMLTRRWI